MFLPRGIHFHNGRSPKDLASKSMTHSPRLKKCGWDGRPSRIDVLCFYCTCLIAGNSHDPSRIVGGVSFGQYRRSIGMNFALGAGSQLASLPLPGESACRYRSTEPSVLVTNLLRALNV